MILYDIFSWLSNPIYVVLKVNRFPDANTQHRVQKSVPPMDTGISTFDMGVVGGIGKNEYL